MGENITKRRKLESKGEKYTPVNLQPICLPMKLIIEILNGVTVKDLLRFKCVSKEWNHLIWDRYFDPKHLYLSPKGSFPVLEQPPFASLQPYDGMIPEKHKVSTD
ncbi:hypothetical protein Tsubulata_027102 [Turnera subulata]|uniref:F-box domain-containing protein n=1 Tax=Turnera subulata TaxID=218843 RepID=A0A9Q0JI72_9ROSI|nr:hypothetical protein Tsubulata_027102 [Turnera subulata]